MYIALLVLLGHSLGLWISSRIWNYSPQHPESCPAFIGLPSLHRILSRLQVPGWWDLDAAPRMAPGIWRLVYRFLGLAEIREPWFVRTAGVACASW
ncbi:hypothetical protein N7462_011451 [Penicillium macrosclerotiorum]|uniref:uncharacterized protein n=1 Tax=Penicillium macrosclerotiorum TaxID=303699 RepID=UPI0025495BE8|nr:uncharacterized protein N7462_011451 [Penicillium macrosclerotiorum]KAJ5664638.1 hypothetical protein N7462_011451 [Penicillium macrosclerotiorum]